jgi:hypothetical protein
MNQQRTVNNITLPITPPLPSAYHAQPKGGGADNQCLTVHAAPPSSRTDIRIVPQKVTCVSRKAAGKRLKTRRLPTTYHAQTKGGGMKNLLGKRPHRPPKQSTTRKEKAAVFRKVERILPPTTSLSRRRKGGGKGNEELYVYEYTRCLPTQRSTTKGRRGSANDLMDYLLVPRRRPGRTSVSYHRK